MLIHLKPQRKNQVQYDCCVPAAFAEYWCCKVFRCTVARPPMDTMASTDVQTFCVFHHVLQPLVVDYSPANGVKNDPKLPLKS